MRSPGAPAGRESEGRVLLEESGAVSQDTDSSNRANRFQEPHVEYPSLIGLDQVLDDIAADVAIASRILRL